MDMRIKSYLCNKSNIHAADDDDDEDEHHAPYMLMFLFFILFIGCLFKTMFSSLRIPYTSLIIFLGFIGGILFNIFSKDDTFVTITTTTSPDLLVAIFLPTLIFESAYRTEYHAFMKSLYSILLISIIGYFLSLFSISIMYKYLFIFQQWTFVQCLLMGIIVSTTRPVTLIRQADYGKTKRLSIILEGEAVINNSLAIILFNSIKSFVVNDQTSHSKVEFFKTTAIALVGGIGLGCIAGILEIISLPYFYDDPISEVTITIAIPYMLYWLCEQVYCSGAVAIVILGLLLSNYKTAISSEATIFMEKFWDMLALIANTIIYLLAALTVVELIKPNAQNSLEYNTILFEIGLAIINYLLCYFFRIIIIIILTLCTKLCRFYHLSWKECLLITWGGFKGSVCLILALALVGEFRLTKNSSKFQYQILIHTIIIVFLSSCINSTYSLLLKILNFTTMSQTKYLYMTQCVDSLYALVQEKIRLLKKNKYLANADWNFIERNFYIENPHINNSNSQQIQYKDLYDEARIRILNIQKTSFWRQYRDYEISTQAVRILSSLCDFAIDRKDQYISIDQLKYYYKPRTFDFIWKYLEKLVKKIHTCIRNDWRKYHKVPENKWRLFYYNILKHKRFNWFITLVILLNVTLAIIRSIYITANLNILLERIANRYVTLSLELCKAYIISQDDVLSKLYRIIEIDQIRNHFSTDSIKRRDEIINELTCIQSEHPNVSASVKTSAAIQILLNYSKNMIHHMTSKGLLGENESHQITEDINKRLHTELVPPVSVFPIPLNLLHIFPWLHDPDVLEYVLSRLHVKLFSLNEYIYKINNDTQALFFITAGYVEIIRNTSKYHDALSIEKYSNENENFYRLLHAPGDILGHIDLLNGQKYTETCKCITNTLVWYLKSNDLIDLIERFNHLRILEKIWHYTAIQLAEFILYEYLNTLPDHATEQERIHIYGHLKRAFLIPESYLIEHNIIYSSHELILIQGQLQNMISSLIYTGPCFIQIEFGQCGLKILNISETKILVLRSPHHTYHDEFILSNDLPDLLKHVIYDEKLDILLPRISLKYKHFTSLSNTNESIIETNKKTLLGRFLESLPKFQRRMI
ncbi:unnamed protein product [Adineta steineri]|uniref:Cyclic nucleotide-binding domain-containing protein n=1 Tax=Adineta steineri TaxID=433720 RepID=A0A815CTI5_9BILA|nr:unnamed protein product [Adineta steineri]